jgi:hypothetical protein
MSNRLFPRSSASLDRTYRHRRCSAVPPSASLSRERIICTRDRPLLALFGHAAISKLSQLSGVRRNKGRLWRKAVIEPIQYVRGPLN